MFLLWQQMDYTYRAFTYTLFCRWSTHALNFTHGNTQDDIYYTTGA